MKSSIIIIGGGASGLMAAYSAAKVCVDRGREVAVTVLEKMPRPARKIMITGKGRCNFSNLKPWNDFEGHVRCGSNLVKSAFYSLTPEKMMNFLEEFGLPTVVERGDRAFPQSMHASDVVDTLVNACNSLGVKIICGVEVTEVKVDSPVFRLSTSQGLWECSRLVVATGGLSYPSTGSTGDGYKWAVETGHFVTSLFPALTALVPRGYKDDVDGPLKGHIDRATALSALGASLNGVELKNIQATLSVEGSQSDSEFGDIYFTDGGIEGPIGFQLSRKAVKSMINGSRVALSLDLKPGVSLTELSARVKELWMEVDKDPRSRNLREKEKCRILLGKLMPWDLIPGFTACHPEIMTLERKGKTQSKVWVNLISIAKALKEWKFDIAGYVGYERAVITCGGVSASAVIPKTLESRIVPGMYFCGEVLDVDCDTGGYNLQCAFSTGYLAGYSCAQQL